MKKTILGIMLTLALVLALVGNVNAASVSASATEVKAGETVSITVKVNKDKPTDGMQFDLKFDPDYFKYESTTTGLDQNTINDQDVANGNLIVWTYSSDGTTTEEVVVTFTALKDTTADSEDFVVSNFESSADISETLEENTVKVTVKTPVEDDPTTDDPTTDDPTDDPTTDDPTTDDPTTDDPEEGPTGSNGEPVDKIPQAGAPIYAGVVAVMVVAGAILLVRKIRK